MAASLGWEGDPRGQDADPPVHAVRVRHVLQLDRLRTLPGAFTHMRNEGVAQPYTYAFACMADYPEDKMARRLALRSRRGCADLVGLWPAWG
jgi:hypothetical protein